QHAVGAMIVFQNGIPDKNEYRKFKILVSPHHDRSAVILDNSPGDTGMLREILTRRFNHPEWPFPDLILVDGGKGQLNAANEVLRIMNKESRIKIIALTKNEKHLGEKIYIQDKEESLSLKKLSPELRNLLLHLDSEAHRFAISYY